jgi:exopolysaccharide biosynthesis polyprenyl glycosylphosphotransferase
MRVTPDTSTAMMPTEVEQALPLPDLEHLAEARPPVQPIQAPASFGRFPRWLKVVDAAHRAAVPPATAMLDLATAAGCAVLAGVAPGLAAALAGGLVVALYGGGKYAQRTSLETQGILWFASLVAMPAAVTALVGVAVAHSRGWDIGDPLKFAVAATVGLITLRAVMWATLAVTRRRGLGMRRTLIVGDSAHARMLAHKLNAFPEAGLLPVAMLPLGNGHGFARFMPAFPDARQLAQAIEEADVEHVVLAPDGSDAAILECVKGSNGLDVSFSMLPPLSEFFLHPTLVTQVGGLPLIPLGKVARTRATLPGKRLFDLVASSVLLIALSPVIALTALAIKLSDRGPVIYRQWRVGRNGGMFQMLKFRSMVEGAERTVIDLRDRNATNGLLFKIFDDPRVTTVGRLIRRLSIDELPQLWNVVRGEMSLVGPRPLAVRPEDFGPIDDQRHTVVPGITGYWQIAGGNGLTYEEMIKLDLAYIENWSMWLDVRLLLRTIPALVHRRGPW